MVNFNYHIDWDRFKTIDFRLETATPLMLGETLMLFARNCRVVAKIVYIQRNVSQVIDENEEVKSFRQAEGTDIWQTYYLEDTDSYCATLEVLKVIDVSSPEIIDVIPDFDSPGEQWE